MGHRWGAKTNKRRGKHNMLVNKRIRRAGGVRLLSQPGSLDLTSCILPGVRGIDTRAGCSRLMYAGTSEGKKEMEVAD